MGIGLAIESTLALADDDGPSSSSSYKPAAMRSSVM
jgi:hypothetical protein